VFRLVVSERNDEAAPVFLAGSLLEVVFYSFGDLPELTVIKAPDEDEPGMPAVRLGPFPDKWGEVATVAGDEHTVLVGGEFEYGRIIEPFEGGVFGECEHIVSGRA
jgi:hypothetical protein